MCYNWQQPNWPDFRSLLPLPLDVETKACFVKRPPPVAPLLNLKASSRACLISSMKALMQRYKQEIRKDLPKLYSQDLLNNLFKYPYTKIEFLERDLQISGRTAVRYLEALIEKGLLQKQKIGRDNFYLNEALFALLSGK
jgi:hypothetical protein